MQCLVRTLSRDNRFVDIRLEARDVLDLRAQLAARGLPAGCASFNRKSLAQSSTGHGVGGFSLILLSQELLALLNAGLSVVECLEALQEKQSGTASSLMISRLLAALHDGKRFSSALAEIPAFFPPLFVGIVRAAENTSDLPQALGRYILFQQRVECLREKLVAASIYPAVLAVVGGAVCLFLVGYVVPRFAEVYQGAGRELPWLSQRLLNCGQFITEHGLLLSSAVLLTALALWRVLRTRAARIWLSAWCDSLPVVGAHLRIVRLSRMYFTLGMLLEGGISILNAIDTVHEATGADMASRLLRARDMIAAGQTLSAAFDAQALVTPISLRLLRVGERSGELGAMLTQSAAFYDGEVTRAVDRFMRMFEPLLMAVIGIVVGAIVVLLYMPIFDLAGSLT